MPQATPQFHSPFYPHREPLLLSAGRERKETTIRVLLVHNNSNCCHESEEHVISFLATIKYNTSYIRPLFVVGFKENNPSIFSSQTTVNCWHESEEHFISFLDAVRYNTYYISCKGIFYLRLPLLKSPTTRTVTDGLGKMFSEKIFSPASWSQKFELKHSLIILKLHTS